MITSTLTDNELLKIASRVKNQSTPSVELLRIVANEAANRTYVDIQTGNPLYFDQSAIPDWLIFFFGVISILGLALFFLFR